MAIRTSGTIVLAASPRPVQAATAVDSNPSPRTDGEPPARRARLLDAASPAFSSTSLGASILNLAAATDAFLVRSPTAAPLVAVPLSGMPFGRARHSGRGTRAGTHPLVEAIHTDAVGIITALANIIDPPATDRSLRAALRAVIEALIRAQDRAVPAGTSVRDAQLAHARIVTLLHRVAQSERG